MARAGQTIIEDVGELHYCEKYSDDRFEYRNIIVPKKYVTHIPTTHLMTETEWRNLGIQQSPGWIHYMLHAPEPHILCFRRPLPNAPPVLTENNENATAVAAR